VSRSTRRVRRAASAASYRGSATHELRSAAASSRPNRTTVPSRSRPSRAADHSAVRPRRPARNASRRSTGRAAVSRARRGTRSAWPRPPLNVIECDEERPLCRYGANDGPSASASGTLAQPHGTWFAGHHQARRAREGPGGAPASPAHRPAPGEEPDSALHAACCSAARPSRGDTHLVQPRIGHHSSMSRSSLPRLTLDDHDCHAAARPLPRGQ